MNFMKEIFYHETLEEFMKKMDEIEYPISVPVSRIIIDYNDSLYSKIDELNIVNRLRGIKQLGLAGTCSDSAFASGTRYAHSLICSTKIDHIAQTHGLERELGVFAGMLHDVGTPPLSDSVAIGLGIKDEEQFVHMLEKCPKLDGLLEEYAVSKKELIETVTGKNKEPIGQLMNNPKAIDVDRFSYSNGDASNLFLLPRVWRGNYVADPFKSVKIYKGKVVFTDFDSVSQLLESRTQMFERIYKNSHLSAKEAFLEQVTKNLFEKGLITYESLFKMVDENFEVLVRRHGGDIGKELFRFDGFESYGVVDASEEAVSDFLKQNTQRPFAVKKHQRIDPAIGTLVMIDGKVDTYEKWEPGHAHFLEKRMSAWNHTNVYGYEHDKKLAEAVYKAQNRFGIPDISFLPED